MRERLRQLRSQKNSDGKYYASLLVDDGLDKPEASTEGKAIGIDLGLTYFAVDRSLGFHGHFLQYFRKKTFLETIMRNF